MIKHISIVDKVATYALRDGPIVCGNSGYKIEFSFDDEWDDYETKTARFIWNGQYLEREFTGNVCDVPVLSDALVCEVGVYAGNFLTSTSVEIECLPSVCCDDSTSMLEEIIESVEYVDTEEHPASLVLHLEGGDTIYVPVVKIIDGFSNLHGADGSDGDSAYEIAVRKGFKGTEEEWLASLHGEDGIDGNPPTINVVAIEGGHRVTITAVDGTKQTIDIMDGAPGVPGPPGKAFEYGDFTAEQLALLQGPPGKSGDPGTPGPPGENGYDPQITINPITESPGGYEIVILYRDSSGRIVSKSCEIYNGSGADITVDSELSETSENPVQNKAVALALKGTNTTVNNLSNEVKGYSQRITDLESGYGNLADNIDANEEKIAANTDSIDGLNRTVNNLSNEVDGYNQRIDSLESDYGKLEEEKANQSDLDKTNQTVNNLASEVGTYSQRITDLESGYGELADDIATNAQGIADLNTDLNSTKQTVNNLSAEVEGHSTRITDLESDYGELADEQTAQAERIANNENAITNLSDTKADKTALDATNATVVGHTNALNDLEPRVGAVEEGKLDKSECSKFYSRKGMSLSSYGWYRVAKFNANNILSVAYGSMANSCDIIIQSGYFYYSSSTHHIQLLSRYYNSKFQSLFDFGEGRLFPKIRHVVDTNNNCAYIDIYYDLNNENPVFVEILNGHSVNNYWWEAIDCYMVAETTDGEDVRCVHELGTNTTLVNSSQLAQTNGNLATLEDRVDGHDSDIGQLQDEKLDKSGGIIYNPNSTTDAPLHIRANNQACYLGFRNNTGEAVGYYGFSASNVPQVAVANVGVMDIIHSGNIGSQHVASATNLISSSEYGVKTDQYGNLHQIKHTSGACWQVVNANGTAMLSVFFDGSEVRVGTNAVLHAGNFETYIRNYMNKTILEQPY